jgi:hypothetical protein
LGKAILETTKAQRLSLWEAIPEIAFKNKG